MTTPLDDAIAKLVERASLVNARQDGLTTGHGIYLNTAEFAAIMRALGREKEAKKMMSLRFPLPDGVDLDPAVLATFHGEIVTKEGVRSLTLPMDETETARDAIAALTVLTGTMSEFVTEFMDETKRFDVRLSMDERMGYERGSVLSTAKPVNECEHPNLPTEEEDGWKCPDCDRLVAAEGYDEVPMRQCNREACDGSGTPFYASEGQNCPSCNTRFTARIADVGCDECEGETGMEKVEVRVCPDCEEVIEA